MALVGGDVTRRWATVRVTRRDWHASTDHQWWRHRWRHTRRCTSSDVTHRRRDVTHWRHRTPAWEHVSSIPAPRPGQHDVTYYVVETRSSCSRDNIINMTVADCHLPAQPRARDRGFPVERDQLNYISEDWLNWHLENGRFHNFVTGNSDCDQSLRQHIASEKLLKERVESTLNENLDWPTTIWSRFLRSFSCSEEVTVSDIRTTDTAVISRSNNVVKCDFVSSSC